MYELLVKAVFLLSCGTKTYTMIKKLLLGFSLFGLLGTSSAQLNYQAGNFINASGTYTDLGTSGTAITTNFTAGAMTFDDDNSSVQNIGFTFNFNGTAYTQFVLNTNGFIKLGAAAPSANNIFYTTFNGVVGSVIDATDNNLIYPFNHDLQGGTSPEFRVFTSGSLPNRICTIQFKNMADKIGTTQYANQNFQIKLYESTNVIEFIYGTWTANANASTFNSAAVGIKGTGAATTVNLTKGSTQTWDAATALTGNYTGNAFNYGNGTRPAPDAGRTYRFFPTYTNDAQVVNVYTLGKLATVISNPHVVSATVKNSGVNALTNIVATLNVTGANTFTNTQTIASLAAGATATVTFTSFNPAIAGANTVTVSIPTDDNLANNSVAIAQTVTTNRLSTAYAAAASLGVGSATTSIDLAAKFTTSTAQTINQITAYFPATSTAQPYQIVILDATGVGGIPGAALYTSATLTSAGAAVNIPISPVVSVNGSFYVAVRQTSATVNVGYGYETESPLRAGIFYAATPAGGTNWADLGNTFKLMFDVQFGAVTPATLSSFSGIKQTNANLLSWTTSTEQNNAGFNLERSADGTNYSSLGFIASKATNGNSNATLTYDFSDVKPLTGTNYYRLKQTDKDGKAAYSQVVLLKGAKNAGVDISVVYPNPVQNTLNVVLTAATTEKVNITVLDVNGKVLSQQTTQLAAGDNKLPINVSKFAAGNYSVQVITENGVSNITKFVKQ
jgi:trimeric autotransporter adhesin